MSTPSETLRLIQRIDALLFQMIGHPTKYIHNQTCGACRKQNRTCIADDAGHVLCADCYGVVGNLHPSQPKRPPQGDDLLTLPRSPKFTKRFQ